MSTQTQSEMIRVLHVDDDPDTLEAVATELEQEGRFDIVHATSAAAALERVDGEYVDCFLCDYALPDRDGLELFEHVRATYPNVPFILLSGTGDEDIVREALDAGITDYVPKETRQSAVLANRIETAVEHERAHAETDTATQELVRTHDRLTDALLGLDADWRHTYVNDPAEQLLDCSESDLYGETIWNTVPALQNTTFGPALREAMETQTAVSVTAWYPPLETRLKARICPADDGLSVYLYEATPEESEQQFLTQVVDEVGVGIAVYNATGRFARVNEAYASLLGVDRHRFERMYVWDINPDIDKTTFETYWETFDEGETRVAETEHVRLDGTAVPVETVTTCRTIQETTYHFGTIREISERKEREQQLQRQNEYLDDFASIVSHDLRNPLNAAMLYLDRIDEECDCEYTPNLESVLDRMEKIVEETLALARSGQQIGDLEPVSLDTVVEDCWETVDTNGATLHIDESARVCADRERLRHLVENLLLNAVTHGGSDVTITIGTTGDGFFVADDGDGLPAVAEAELFDSSFTEDEDGTGLGLAIVERIVEAHGWDISATESETGGARFEIRGCLAEENAVKQRE